MEIPKLIIDEAERKGIDIVDLIAKALSLDPSTTSKAHLELAEKFLNEGRELISKDPVQASEKLYKAAEEAIKAIAITLGLDEAKKASEIGRWTAQLLFDAVDNTADRLSRREVRWWWGRAWFLHVEGFHEARLRSDQVRRDLPDIEALVNLAKSISGTS
ncbi:MAG: PaREP1 family protein [Vulcanisaeta sp.]|uniref:PaREP1 domain containing protein n=1 Tax=Vulcanisaeta moutnovskia (strain 768-28) TaxID=985053 RepID=F0QWR8_VULM7|nr:PaREP1 family protein [Vulcanisaeta moutnovskia]ADY02285.1 PaREP1 domain containing protein [Vulcanisaeta moutnovskia 768-28]